MRFTLTRRKLLNVHKKVRERTSTLDLYMFYMYMYRPAPAVLERNDLYLYL